MLLAAREWGTPPWEFAGGKPLTWFLRWEYYAQQRGIAHERAVQGMRDKWPGS